MSEKEEPNEILCDGKIFRKYESENILGWIPVKTPPEGEVDITWKGASIPTEILRECLGFFIYADKEHKGEGQVRLFYNSTTRQWKAWAFPQECAGLSTKEIEDDPDWSEIS